MQASDLTISAIIPIYNGRAYIEAAIRSVLSQTRPPAELILVDDGSTDGSAALVADIFPDQTFVYLQQPNGGQSSARNLGVKHARGTHIALLDQDDVWYPDHLARLAEPFLTAQTPELGWSYSNLDEIDGDGTIRVRSFLDALGSRHPKRDVFACLRENMFVLPSASLIARTAFDAVGGFDERLSGFEDDDLFLRLFRAGYGNDYIPTALSQWRVDPASSSYSPRMARSRRVYAEKLLAAFPDDERRSRFYTRELLVPRFHPEMVEEVRRAIRGGDPAMIEAARSDLAFIRKTVPAIPRAPLDPNMALISAVIPLYNGASWIEAAIGSVQAQTLAVAELIVVDDGSTDDGPAIVERLAAEHPITLIRRPNGGQASARNLGIARSSGDFIALLDQDDVWYPRHVELLIVPFLQPRLRELGWAYSNLDEVDEDGNLVVTSFLSTIGTQHPKRDVISCMRYDMYVLPSASMISRRAFEAVGGFDEALSGYEDDDLFLRMFQAGYANEYIEAPLSQWRFHAASASNLPRMARSRMAYARKLLAAFPDDAARARHYTRDLLVPRFFPQILSEYLRARSSDDPQWVEVARHDLDMFAGHLSRRQALILSAIKSPLLGSGQLPGFVRVAARMARSRLRRLLRL